MKILVVDVETNGLFGMPFAVGALVFDTDTLNTLTSFCGRGPVVGEPVEFVNMHVLPAVTGLPEYQSNAQLRLAFWQWYKTNCNGCKVFADVGYPVESLWFRVCQADVGDSWGGPYPLHEIATLLLATGIDDDISRNEFADNPLGDTFEQHNPMHDAIVSAHVVAKCFNKLFNPVVENINAVQDNA